MSDKKEASKPALSLANAMRATINANAKKAYDSMDPKAKKKKGEYRDIAMDPTTAVDLMTVKDFILMRPYFKIATGVEGFPQGGISQIVGKSDSGKSTMLSEAMVSTQKAGGICFFIDSEHKFAWDRFEAMGGVAADVIAIPVESLEDAWDAWWVICQQVQGIREEGLFKTKDADGKEIAIPVDKDVQVLAAWDSVPSSVANKILDEDSSGDAHVAVEAKVNNKAVRKLKQIIKTSRVAAVFVNHAYMTMPMMGAPEKVLKGGEEMFYMSSLIIELIKGATIFREVTAAGEKHKQKIGRESRIDVLKGHMSGRTTVLQVNVCAPGILNDEEFAEYRKSIQGKL